MIKFQNIRWKNMLSTGNYFTEIQLDRSPNTLIIGQNGAGKSTILDALCFVLFGKPFRKINKPSLLNSINGKELVVEIEFKIGEKQYKVIRGIKPNIFEIYCDGRLTNQDATVKDYQEHLEKFVLKMNYKTFTQVVILGSASFVPFMQLSPADRRTIIEDLLDIEIFSTMNTLVKQKLVTIKDNATTNKYNMELVAEKIKLQKQNIEDHKNHNIKAIESKKNEILQNENQILELQNKIGLVQEHISVMQKSIMDGDSITKKKAKLVSLETQLETKFKKVTKEIGFYKDNDNCPTCRQLIDEEYKQKQIESNKATLDELQNGLDELTKQMQTVTDRIGQIQSINESISEHNTEIVKHQTSISAIQKYIGILNKEVVKLSNTSDSMEKDNSKLKELKEELSGLVEEQKHISGEKQYYDFAATLLKDSGIKTRIIKQYLPVMNKLINKYLTQMNFFVNFNIDENFEETIKSRHRDVFSYYNFSEGEKFRIDLALLFTWRTIAKLKNSASTNLLILDEVFDSSLDVGGTDEFMKLIHDLGGDTHVFVISHKGDQLFDKFRSVIRFEKKNNFSQVAK